MSSLEIKFDSVPQRRPVELAQKMLESSEILSKYSDPDIQKDFTPENFRSGIIPRISNFDEKYLPENARLVEIPQDLREELFRERSYDLIRWNKPDQFLFRLKLSQEPFQHPVKGKSRVMERFIKKGKGVSFDDLRVLSPEPTSGRQSRTDIDAKMETNIMGQARIPFALGSVPDVGSYLSYVTIAQANGMAFISRDKILSDVQEQVKITEDVINYLKNVKLPEELQPLDKDLEEFAKIKKIKKGLSKGKLREQYFTALRVSWIANVGAAIEASPRGVERAKALYEVGCKLFRVYSPEGGKEIIDTVKDLKKSFDKDDGVKIVAGQIMDLKTAKKAQKAGADALFLGVAGGSQCTTSVNADIPVNTPNLLYQLRGKIKIPVGIEGGGVGTHIETAFALGASFVSKPGEIGVSFEGSGGKYMFQTPDGQYYMIYGGEASVSAKWWKDSVDDLGRPKFVEGETGVRVVDKDKISMTRNLRRLRHMLSVGSVFQRKESIEELHRTTCHNIVQVTPDASALSKAYGQ